MAGFNILAALGLGGLNPQGQVNDDILVNAGRTAPGRENNPAPPPMSNKSYLEEAQGASQNAPVHKGMFGTQGTLRDILGLVGDAFLVNSGNKAVYQPKRQQERQSDALGGVTADPLAAIERMSQVDPASAQKLYEDYQGNQIKKDAYASLGASREAQAAARKAAGLDKFTTLAARMLGGATTPEARAATIGLLKKSAGARGIDLMNDLGISDDMSDDEISSLVGGDMSNYQKAQVPISQQNADTRESAVGVQRQNASTNASRASEVARHNKAQEGTATQRANTYQQATDKKGTSSLLSNVPPPSGGGKLVFRNGKLVRQ